MTRKLVESTFVTLDGVIGDPQVWGPPYWDTQHSGYVAKLFDRTDALLLGRVTYEGFAEAWPSRAGDAFADRMNAIPKYVASRTLTDTTWNASLLEGDAAAAVAALKDQDGGDLLKFGTGEFDLALLADKLVDEYHFWMFPVVAGSGERLFEGAALDTTHLQLVETTPFDSGIVVLTYTTK